MTALKKAPHFRDLAEHESLALLERNHVGRLAFSFHDAVDIRPIHYVFADGWIFGRTSPGDKLVTLRHNQWAAFEVDEIAGPFDWMSIIVRGTFYRTDPGGSAQDQRFHERAVASIKKVSPDAFSDDDPVSFRTEVFAIHIDSFTGRSSSMEE